MAPAVDDVVEPVAIFRIAGRYLLFDVNTVTYLRQKHNICGVLVGTIPQAPQQNVFQGLPVQLLPEEARLLVEKEIGYIVDDAVLHKDWLVSLRGSERKIYLDSLRGEANKAQKNAKMIARMKSQRSLAMQASNQLSQSSTRRATSGLDDLKDLNSTLDEESNLFEADGPQSSVQSIITPSYAVTPTTTVMPPNTRQKYQPNLDPPVPTSYPLFAHLHGQNYFITPGLRFGCDYTVYPGDPLRFHSHFLATSYRWKDEIPLLDLVGGGRLGTGVKKGFLIGGEKAAAGGKDRPSVRTFSIEWGGM